ncbi:MAG: aldo/keto reductase [Christensenellales bacterium]|jgi:predicted aldo/keto reductase-like oxidoreductase
MQKARLGKSGLWVSRSSFGCLPIQRVELKEAVRLLCKAYDSGFNFFDTARIYTDSEEKLGCAFQNKRQSVFIATKTQAKNANSLWKDLEVSLKTLKTDYIDLYQLHNPSFVPLPGGEDGIYDALIDAKNKGLIRHIGITSHVLDVAKQAVRSGLYETLQFPFSCLSSKSDETLVKLCNQEDIGFIAMKALSGGLIKNIKANFCYLSSFENVVPIWGIQMESELEEFISLEKNPPAYNERIRLEVDKERKELSGEFCRGCGYCLPCPAKISIPMVARMDKFLSRGVVSQYTTPEWINKMVQIEDCILCEQCESKCPYQLKPYKLIKKQLDFYRRFCAENNIPQKAGV